jgi:hypothetical protein
MKKRTIFCQSEIQTTCNEVAFKLNTFEITHDAFCRTNWLEIGNKNEPVTSRMCGESRHWDRYYLDNPYPSNLFQWTSVKSSNFTFAFFSEKNKSSKWSFEFKCVEDLRNRNIGSALECDTSDSIYGKINYLPSENVVYDENPNFFNSENGKTVGDESECAKVCYQACTSAFDLIMMN